jgi:hypothetical protein
MQLAHRRHLPFFPPPPSISRGTVGQIDLQVRWSDEKLQVLLGLGRKVKKPGNGEKAGE